MNEIDLDFIVDDTTNLGAIVNKWNSRSRNSFFFCHPKFNASIKTFCSTSRTHEPAVRLTWESRITARWNYYLIFFVPPTCAWCRFHESGAEHGKWAKKYIKYLRVELSCKFFCLLESIHIRCICKTLLLIIICWIILVIQLITKISKNSIRRRRGFDLSISLDSSFSAIPSRQSRRRERKEGMRSRKQ